MDFKLILGIVGNVIAIALFASPLPTFWNIYKSKSTQDFSGFPYVCTLMNCLLWVLYGLPVVTDNALLVLTINAAGCAFEVFYLVLFLMYSPKMERRKVAKVLSACCTAFTVLVALTLGVVPRKTRKLEVGSICVAVGVAMYVSPLSVMRLVIKTRSVQFMPLALSVCVFLNSTVWTGYGIIAKDIFIIIPNALGMLAGVIQLSLHAVYRNAKPRLIDSEETSAKGSIAAGGDIHIQSIHVPIEKERHQNRSKLPSKSPSATPRLTNPAGRESVENL